MGGNPRLRKPRDRGKLGHCELLAFEQGDQAQPGGIGKQAEELGKRAEVHFILSSRKSDERMRVRPHAVKTAIAASFDGAFWARRFSQLAAQDFADVGFG